MCFDVWKKYKAETIFFLIGLFFELFYLFFQTFSDEYSYWFNIYNIDFYFFPIIMLFGWLFFKLNKTEGANLFLVFIFAINAFILFLYAIKYLSVCSRNAIEMGIVNILFVICIFYEIAINILAMVLLFAKPKNSKMILGITILVFLVLLFATAIMDIAENDIYSIIDWFIPFLFVVCYYVLVFLLVGKHLGGQYLGKPSAIEQELIALKDKKDLGLITAEEYAAKHSEIIKKLQEK